MVQHVGVFAGSLPHTEAHSADDRVAHARVSALIAVGEPGGNAGVDGSSVGNAERGHIALGGVLEGPEAHDRGDLQVFFPNLYVKPVLTNRAVPRGDSDFDIPGWAEGILSPGTSKQPAIAWVASKAPITLAATTSVMNLSVIFIDVLPTVFKVCV
jgi:hypothetical protein